MKKMKLTYNTGHGVVQYSNEYIKRFEEVTDPRWKPLDFSLGVWFKRLLELKADLKEGYTVFANSEEVSKFAADMAIEFSNVCITHGVVNGYANYLAHWLTILTTYQFKDSIEEVIETIFDNIDVDEVSNLTI